MDGFINSIVRTTSHSPQVMILCEGRFLRLRQSGLLYQFPPAHLNEQRYVDMVYASISNWNGS